MKRINVLLIIINSIFLIIFNAFFFVLGGLVHNTSVWVSYIFIHFAYIMLLITPKLIREGKSSAVFGFSIYYISSMYFLVEFVTGLVFIILAPEKPSASILVQLSIAGVYGILLISHLIANEHTADEQEKRQIHIDYVKNASLKIKALLDKIQDKEIKKKIEKVYDAIYSSPVKSHPGLEKIENEILVSIEELEDAIQLGDKENIIASADSLLASVKLYLLK